MPPVVETAGFTPLVNGNELSGWEGDTNSGRPGTACLSASPRAWIITSSWQPPTPTAISCWLLDFRLADGKGNSGVQFRSVRVPPHEMSGYQADIGEGYWGSLYDESRRNKVLVPAPQDAIKALNKSDWNHYAVRAMGDHIILGLGGKVAVNYRETEPSDRAVGPPGRADPCRRSDGNPVQKYDDPTLSHAHGRRSDRAGVPPPHGQDRPRATGNSRSTCPKAMTGPRPSR